MIDFPSPQYHYYSLKRKPPNFRLLSIQPGTNTSLIKVIISTHRLSKAPEYEALSYVWGPPSLGGEPNLILVNDSPFEVTPNLLKALSGLRSESNVRLVWIDAICINQEDLEERSQQVQLMKQIYENATRTVVFLGEASELSSPTINFIRSLKMKRQWNSSAEMEEFQHASENLAERVAKDEYLQILTTKGLFGDLLERPFWKRIWIVQEVVLGKSAQ
jgi:Heterokaryon incompatibility protein (HET)